MSKTLFHYKEICLATGLSPGIVRYRMTRLGIKNSNTLTYEDVKKIVSYRSRPIVKIQKARVDELKLALKNDGYPIAEKRGGIG